MGLQVAIKIRSGGCVIAFPVEHYPLGKSRLQRITHLFGDPDIGQRECRLIVLDIGQSALQTQGLVVGRFFYAQRKCSNTVDNCLVCPYGAGP